MFACLRLATAGAHESVRFKMSLVGTEVASTGPQPSKQCRLAARE